MDKSTQIPENFEENFFEFDRRGHHFRSPNFSPDSPARVYDCEGNYSGSPSFTGNEPFIYIIDSPTASPRQVESMDEYHLEHSEVEYDATTHLIEEPVAIGSDELNGYIESHLWLLDSEFVSTEPPVPAESVIFSEFDRRGHYFRSPNYSPAYDCEGNYCGSLSFTGDQPFLYIIDSLKASP